VSDYFIVWNANRSEGFVTNDERDALKAAGKMAVMGIESTIGREFRETYDDDKLMVQRIDIKPELSARARKLLERVRRGDWYSTERPAPKAMQELIDNGLVKTTGRVKVIERAYVAIDHQGFIMDRAPDEPNVS